MKKILLLGLLFLTGIASYGQNYITTMAGNGIYGYSGNGGTAMAASMYRPVAVVYDVSGNLYISDSCSVRKISTSGVITTFAGTGTSGYLGDGGQATDAQLSKTAGLAIDASGNIYIADPGNQVVRVVNTVGIISTYAGNGTMGYSGDGGLATSAQFYSPFGLVFDAAGNLYVADAGNGAIRKIDPAGYISTFAGTGLQGYTGDGGLATAAELYAPVGLVFDGTGNLYISDVTKNVIRAINTSGIITTIAGVGTQGYSGDGGLATAAQFYGCGGIAFDATGNLYISDVGNQVIRKINTSGIISTIAGTGNEGYSGDGGLAASAQLAAPAFMTFSASGDLIFADDSNSRVRRIGPDVPPTFTGGANQNLTVCINASATPINTLLAVTDAEVGQIETWSVVSGPAHGILVASYSTTSTGSTLTPTGFTYTPATGYSGSDVFTVQVSDGTAISTTTITVTVSTGPTIPAITAASFVCIGSATNLTDAVAGGTWSSTNSAVAAVNATTGVVTGVAAGTANISYTVTNACGTNAVGIAMTVNALPTVYAGPDIYVCASGTGLLTGTGATTYSWSPATYLSATAGSTVSAHMSTPATTSIMYTLTGTDANGCVNTDNVVVNYSIPITAIPVTIDQILPSALTGDTTFTSCGNGITLSVNPSSGLYTYSWTGAGTGTPGINCSTCQATFINPSTTSSTPLTFTYTVSVSQYGCTTNRKALVVLVNSGSCSPCSYFATPTCTGCGAQPFHTLTTEISGPLAPGNYFTNGHNFGGNATYSNCNFYFIQSTSIATNVSDTADITFSNCHLNSPCGWYGLNIKTSGTSNAGRVTFTNNTLLENAGYSSISSSGGVTFSAGNNSTLTSFAPANFDTVTMAHAIVTSDGAIFNKNSVSIAMSYWPTAAVAPNVMPLKVVNSVFTAADFSTYHSGAGTSATDYYPYSWPSVITLKTIAATGSSDALYNPRYGIDDYDSTVAHLGAGVSVQGGYTDTSGTAINYKKYIIGNRSDISKSNLFCNLIWGAGSSGMANSAAKGANIVVYNSVFKLKYTGTPVTNNDYGVNFFNTLDKNKFLLGVGDNGSSADTGSARGNKFYNMLIAVNVQSFIPQDWSYYTFVGRNSLIASKGGTTAGYSLCAHSFDKTDINDNVIYNAGTGMFLLLKSDTGVYHYGSINMNNNILSAAGSIALSGTSMSLGIGVRDVKAVGSASVNDLGLLSMTGNKMGGVYNGIEVDSLVYKPFQIDQNRISLANNTASGGVQAGIRVYNYKGSNAMAGGNEIAQDSITGPGYNTPAVTHNATTFAIGGHQIQAISVNLSGSIANSISVNCNHVRETNIGYYFQGADTLQWFNNVMYHNRYGMALAGSIGTQGSSTSPIENWWENDASGWWTNTSTGNGYATIVSSSGSPAAGNSELYVSGGADSYPSTVAKNLGDSTHRYTYLMSYHPLGVTTIYPSCTNQNTGTDAFRDNTDNTLTETAPAEQHYSLMPNPNNGTFSIVQGTITECALHIRIVNTVGAVVYESNEKVESGKIQMNVDNLVSGLYIVELMDSNGTRSVSKIIVQK